MFSISQNKATIFDGGTVWSNDTLQIEAAAECNGRINKNQQH